VLRTIATYTDGSPTGSWLHATGDLSAYAGQTVQLALVGTNDSSYPTSFYVDDVSLLAS
jgi:kumamolisin